MKNIFNVKENIKNQIQMGFSVIEVLVACMIISMITIALMSAASKGIVLSDQALKQVQASELLEEGVEAVKSIRDTNWTTISDLTTNTTYYLTYNINTNIWSLGTTQVDTIDGLFTRTIVVSPVYRDSNDDIASSGTLDTGIKEVEVRVSWLDSGESKSKNITFYLSNIFN